MVAPVPTTPILPSPEADEFTTLVNRYRDSGLTYEEALNQAKQDFVETGRGDQLDTRTSKPSISVPSERLETPAGAPTAIAGGVGRTSPPTATTPSGEGTELGPLEVKELNKLAVKLDRARTKLESIQSSQVRGGPEEVKATAALTKAEGEYFGFLEKTTL
jgi:hypothetical protein